MTWSNRYFHPFVFACLLLGLAGCSTFSRLPRFSPRQTMLTADRVALPTSSSLGMLWVEVRINGAGPFRLLVDTGCSRLVLAQQVADTVGLKPLPDSGTTINGAIDNKTRGTVTWVDHLESGGLKLEGLAAMLVDDADLANASAAMGVRIEGALGMAALKDLVLEMDFPKQQVTVVRPGTEHYPRDRAAVYEGSPPRVKVDVGWKSIGVMIDTGSMGGLEIPKLDAIPLLYPKIKDDGGAVGIGKSTLRGESSQVAGEVRLGPVTWLNPPIAKGNPGSIGVAALNTWKLAIDQHARRIYFLGGDPHRKWDERKPPDLRFRAGCFASIQGTGFRLLEVDAGGAYDLAGLRVGDVIVTVDGAPAMDYCTSHASQEAGSNPRPKLRVQRDGNEFEAQPILAPDTPSK